MLIDTHTHLYLPEFDEDRPEMLQRALASGVEAFYLPNIDHRSTEPMLALEAAYPAHCFAMMGLHPCSVKEDFEAELKTVEHWLSRRPFVAIGEIGIDLYWEKAFFDAQKQAFRQQLNWSAELGLPVVIHSRESTDIIIEILRQEKNKRLHGIFHCFSGNLDQAHQIIDLGFSLGIGGVLTFKKSGLDAVVAEIPLEHLVLETDSPYLAPVPHRGKRNESAYVRLVAEKLSNLKSLDIELVEQVTTENAQKIFKKTSPSSATLS